MYRYRIVLLGTLWLIAINLFGQDKLSLERCLHVAYENNLEIKEKRISNKKNVIDLKIARSEFLPDLNGYGTIYSKFGQGQDVFGTTRRNDNLNSDVGLSANMLISNRRLKREVQKAEIMMEVGEQDLKQIMRNIARKVIEAFLLVQLNKEQLRTVDSSVHYAYLQYDKAVKTTKVGTTALSVEYEAKANLDSEKQRRMAVAQDLMRARISLFQILRLTDYENLDIVDPVETVIGEFDSDKNKTVADVLSISPELKRLDHIRSSLLINESIIKTSLYPTVKASAALGALYFNNFADKDVDPMFRQFKDNFSQQIGLSVSIPIFNKGMAKREMAKNRIEIAQTDVLHEEAEYAIVQDLNKLFYDLEAYYNQYITCLEVTKSVEIALGFTRKSFDAGKSTIYDLNNSNKNYITAQSEAIKAKYNYLYTYRIINLYLENY